jgi:hypothetical protein
VRPLLEQALHKRAAQGTRVVVEVAGTDAAAAAAFAKQLGEVRRVTRAKVKNVSAKGAILDVVVAGGDGITLALELAPLSLSHTVQTASAGQLRLAARP